MIKEKIIYTNYQGVKRNTLLLINDIEDEVFLESMRNNKGTIVIEEELDKLEIEDFKNKIIKLVILINYKH